MIENDRKHYIEIGEEKKMHEMIINLYNNGASLELLSKSSGLSKDKIKSILKNKIRN